LSAITASSIQIKQTTNETKDIVSDSDSVKKYAVVVGTGFVIQSTNDAQDMKKILRDNGWDVTCLTFIEATKPNILASISLMGLREDSNDIVMFYFSGHGTYNTIAAWGGLGISVGDLNDRFDSFDSKKMVMIFDTCHAGSLPKASSEENNIDGFDGIFDRLAKVGRTIITSCKRFENSAGSSELNNGIFTYYYLEGLEGKGFSDKDFDGKISAKEAFKYAKPKTTLTSSGKQHPQIYDGIIGDIEITEVEEPDIRVRYNNLLKQLFNSHFSLSSILKIDGK
jgi:hypothetical protein